jgi:hypothetical protein
MPSMGFEPAIPKSNGNMATGISPADVSKFTNPVSALIDKAVDHRETFKRKISSHQSMKEHKLSNTISFCSFFAVLVTVSKADSSLGEFFIAATFLDVIARHSSNGEAMCTSCSANFHEFIDLIQRITCAVAPIYFYSYPEKLVTTAIINTQLSTALGRQLEALEYQQFQRINS